MKTRFVASAMVAVIVGIGVIPAAAKGKKQVVEGSFVLSAKHTDGGCFAGLSRRSSVLTGGAINGVTGYVFDVDKATWNRKFKLEPTGGQGHVDVDIVFYVTLGEPADQVDPATAPAYFEFKERSPDGEAGVVPKTVTKAIVCSYIDENAPPAAGVGISFLYTAG